jgi:hypothetical protein
MNWCVTAGKSEDDPKQSIHIFTSRDEACNFINWIQDFNPDLNITMKPYLVNEKDSLNGHQQRVPDGL